MSNTSLYDNSYSQYNSNEGGNIGIPYLFSAWGPWFQNWVEALGEYEQAPVFVGETPGPADITTWAGVFSGSDFLGPNWNTALVSYLQAVFLSPDDGLWHLGGWDQNARSVFGGDFTWDWVDAGPIGATPDGANGLTGYVQAQATATEALGAGGAPPSPAMCAAVAQCGPVQDFNLVGFGFEPLVDGTAPAGFVSWPQPRGGPNTGGPTISATALLQGYDLMWVSGPLQNSLLNGTAFFIGLQGSAADGTGASPLYVISLHTNDLADFGEYGYNVWPAVPAPPPEAKIDVGCGFMSQQVGGELPVENSTRLFAYQPNGDGTYSPWVLVPNATAWEQIPIVTDITCCLGGFGVGTDTTYIGSPINTGGQTNPSSTALYFIGYSTSWKTNIVAVARVDSQSIDPQWLQIEPIVVSKLTRLGGSQPQTAGQILDGFPVSTAAGAQWWPNYEGEEFSPPGIPVTQLSTVANPVIAQPPYFVDVGSATYSYGPDGYQPVTGAWLRTPVATTLEGWSPLAPVKQIAPIRMFQRSDGWGVRQFQLSGSANSPMSVRQYPHSSHY